MTLCPRGLRSGPAKTVGYTYVSSNLTGVVIITQQQQHINALIAQLEEYALCKRNVVGSKPIQGYNLVSSVW